MSRPPHILIVMTDQQRADTMGCAGHSQIRTPNLDRIAREGVRFAQAITVSPFCMPARVSFAEGRYPHNHGMWSNHGAMSRTDVTLFQLLQGREYFTALVGKAHYYEHKAGMHLKERENYMRRCGFEYVHETTGPNSSTHTGSYLTDEWQKRGLWELVKRDYDDRRRAARAGGGETVRASVLSVEDSLDAYIGTQAVRFVETYEDPRPLCLSVGFGGPHDPWDAPGEFATMYRPEETPPPIPIPPHDGDAPEWVTRNMAARRPPASSALVAQIRANYYGKISLIDRQIGRILQAYERRGWLAELLIVFLSDHGEMLGDHGRLRKGTFHEAAVRIPLLVRWPGHAAANAVSEALVENIDVFPTLLEAAGAASSQSVGRSLWPVLRQPGAELKDSQLSEFEADARNVMLRTRRYKFAIDGQSQGYMLYDLQQDPHEQSNLAGRADAAGLAGKLHRELDKRFADAQLHVGRERGFTLIELTIALVLLALMASVLYGSLSLAGTSWDRGELKAQRTGEMRLTEDFLRRTLSSQHPLRFQKVVDKPLYFVGASDSLSYAVALPGRAGAGIYFFKIALTPNGDASRLTLARVIPDYAATAPPDFSNADVSILADGVAEARFGYFGRDPGSADVTTPTWRDRWDDSQRLPDLIRLDVKLANGTSWPPLIVEPELSMQVGCLSWNPAARRCT